MAGLSELFVKQIHDISNVKDKEGHMARVAGVDLPENKKVEYALPYIYGVGHTRSCEILEKIGIDHNRRVKDLTEEEVATLQREVTNSYAIEGDLRKQIKENIRRLQEIGSYRGIRHKRSLPVRGQRTKTNARGRKGSRKKGSVLASTKKK